LIRKEQHIVKDFPFPPPYGVLNNFFAGLLKDPIPADWHPPKVLHDLKRAEAWKEWHDQRTKEIAAVLWPQFDSHSSQWKGPLADVKYMLDLTRLDLALMLEIQHERILHKHIESPVTPADKTHHDLFKDEDSIPFKNTYHFYDPHMGSQLRARVENTFMDGLSSKVGGSHVQWKAQFQRPRAYQMAMLLGNHDFKHEQAITSDSPSLVSGHCLQGLLGGGAVIERFLKNPPSAHIIACLEQWSVDFGDRRVMAGVHYPSDNLSSWIAGMYLAGRVYREPEVKEHLWAAITKRSFVYKVIIDAVERKKGDLYKPALDALTAAAARTD
jgi:hypothetical protein